MKWVLWTQFLIGHSRLYYLLPAATGPQAIPILAPSETVFPSAFVYLHCSEISSISRASIAIFVARALR